MVAVGALGCGEPKAATQPGTTQRVFDQVSPSVVAILNDIQGQMDAEALAALRDEGKDPRRPPTVIDVSLRKEPMPHGTGFLIDGGIVITAAHVVLSPDRLKLTTKTGQTVDAELVYLDEVRDVALLKPKTPLLDVPPLALATANPTPGHRV